MNTSDLRVRVLRKTSEALDISTFELVHADGDRPLPAFSAGSHVDVQLPNGLTRQYSLCNDPTESHRYLIGVLRDPASRGGSAAMHEQVKEGDLLHISAIQLVGYGALTSVAGLWGGPYLYELHGLDPVARGNVLMAMNLAVLAGRWPMAGWRR